MRSELAGRDTWLHAAAIAAAAGGRVLRSGAPARRVVTDSRLVQPGDCFVALTGENFDGHRFVDDAISRGAAGIVASAPLPRRVLATGAFIIRVEDSRRSLLGMAAEHRRRHAVRVVGITGSCGKTSTKDMLGQVLGTAMPTVCSPQSYNNDIGVPLTLFAIGADTAAAVVEIGTSAPGEIARLTKVAAPDLGIVTCVAQAHLSGLRSLGGVAEEKAALVIGLPENGVAVLNGDDGACRKIAERVRARCVFVRIDRAADWWASDVRFHGLGTMFQLHRHGTDQTWPVTLPRLGTHNVYNALFTVAAASEFDVCIDTVLGALCRVPASGRRFECKQAGTVTVFDDTYNMNPASARAALSALAGLRGDGRKIVVFGEMLELGDEAQALHGELGADVARAGVDLLMTVGSGARAIDEGARAAGMPDERVLCAGDPLEALEAMRRLVRPGDLVLCKASRRVGLDRLVDGLLNALAGGA